MLYAVNGPTTSSNPVMGFTLDPDRSSVVSTWGPTFDVSNAIFIPRDLANRRIFVILRRGQDYNILIAA
jgi:hypothetical protein